MSGHIMVVLLVGAAGGVGVWMLVLLLVPERSDLVAALSQPRGLPAPAAGAATQGRQQPDRRGLATAQAWIEQKLSAVPWLATPDRDLMVVEISRGTFLLVRVAASVAALLVGPVYSLVFAVFGFPLPLVVPAAVGLVLAAVTWLTVGVVVHAQAESRRREMRYALVSYLTLVALHRAAGQAMGKSLELAAASSSAWTFQRIAQRMALATRSGSNEWAGLAQLAGELGIDELSDLASIADTAGIAGAGVYSTLMARAQSLRHELQTAEEAAAAAASTRLAIPKVILTFTTFVFLLYPALMQLVG
ncbi:MAG TPA: type II secretion system F family protein [Mycobacterium sp.]